MGRVLTNNVGLAYAVETSLGVASTDWFQIEPNGIPNFGAVITTVARDPISQNRQRRKGTVTDLDSAVEVEADLTYSAFRDFAEGFAFVIAVNRDVTQLAGTAAVASGGNYTGLPFLSSAQANKFEIDTLIWVTGGAAANIGLKVLDVDASAGDTQLSVADTLTDETASFRISFAGHRIAASDTPTWTWDAVNKQATLAETGIGAALQALGLTLGQRVHIGSVAEIGGAIQNAFENTAANDMFGYARVISFATDSVVFDKVGLALQFTDSTSPATAVDVLFGEFIRNVSVSSSEFIERSYQVEGSFPNLGDGTVGNTDTAYRYAKGNFGNTLVFNIPLTDKATITASFIGTDTDNPTTTRRLGFTSAAASGVLTLSANALDTETVTIGATTYTFQTTLVDAANNVLIGVDASASIDNLIAAITAGAGAGTNYGTGTTANASATASAGAGDTMTVTALVAGSNGNSIPVTETLTNGAFEAATLAGGSNGLNEPTQTAAYNTSQDIAALRVTEVDEDALTTDFTALTMTLNNNVSPQKVLGQLGARFINFGNFEIDIEATLIFSNPLVINAIRDNQTLTMDFVLKNDDGVIAVDIPSLTIGGGGTEFPINESVLLNTTIQAFGDPTLNTSLSFSLIPVPLP